jgi:hypothetical protein
MFEYELGECVKTSRFRREHAEIVARDEGLPGSAGAPYYRVRFEDGHETWVSHLFIRGRVGADTVRRVFPQG